VIQAWGSPGAGSGQSSSPAGIGTDAAGDVYVADSGNNRIQKFNASGAYLTQWRASELFDLAGRRIEQRSVGPLGAGPHAVELAPGRRLSAGVYTLRLTQGANTRNVRAVVLE